MNRSSHSSLIITLILSVSSFFCLPSTAHAQLDAGPDDTINPGVPVTLTATYGEIANSLMIDDDGVEGPFPIGFSFSFFGSVYTEFYIGANGWISFSPNVNASGTRQAFAVPSAADYNPRNCILGPFQDMNPLQAGSPYLFYLTVGNAPDRKLVVMWCQVPMYWCVTSYATFQIVLNEGSNTIENHIADKPPCLDWLDNLATLGVQNSTGFVGYAVPGRNASSWEATEEGWQYTPTSVDSFQIASIPFRLEPIVPGDKIDWAWFQGSEQISDQQSITVTPKETTVYLVEVTLCNGQQFTDTVTVTVLPNIPDAFSPNGDGLNDKFRIIGIPPENITRFNLEIYDRWGQLIFHSTNILDSWDGFYKGEICPAGVYPWVMYWEDDKKIRKTNKGTVTLVR